MINTIWNRIVENEGNEFKQIRGKVFKYKIKGNSIELTTTNRAIHKNVVEEAMKFVPLENTVPLQNLQAPSYLFAILMDSRIRKSSDY
ncbi:MAG: hypothetical protein N4A40_12320 [Tissierellales bacterium]|jgi:hypothetical protein|nr:hypothetical protein [Tissierellales bacterium]